MKQPGTRLFADPADYQNTFDAVIVGTGLTGGWAAKELSESGFEVLLLDAGPLLTPAAVNDLSWWNQSRRQKASIRQAAQARHPTYWKSNPQLFVDDHENPYRSDTDFVWIRGRQLGGRSLTWGGLALRFSDHEFLAPDRDGFGALWPINYRDLEPYYAKVERFLHVQGSQDGLEQLPDGVFALPPDLTETEKRFKSTVESLWPHRTVIGCRGIPNENDAGPSGATHEWLPKTSLHATIPAAFATGRTTLRPDSIVSHLRVEPNDGSIQGVSCIDRVTKQSFEVYGRVVLLCASTIESVRIMLNSKDRHHPDGVGNSSGILGRYLVDHIGVTVAGEVPHSAELPRYPLGGAHGICVPKFRNVYEPCESFIRGYGIWGGMQRGRAGYDGRRARTPTAAAWFQTAILEVLPRQTNGIRIDTGRVDEWGVPTVRIHLEYGDNEQRMKTDALRCMLEMSEAAGLDVARVHVTAPGCYVHELGGARMGSDPQLSVLDPWNRCWDARNLFVLDGSCFVTSGWQNPSLTMMALAVRACDGIAASLKGQNVKSMNGSVQ